MTKAFRFARTGGPEVLEWTNVEVKSPGRGEASGATGLTQWCAAAS